MEQCVLVLLRAQTETISNCFPRNDERFGTLTTFFNPFGSIRTKQIGVPPVSNSGLIADVSEQFGIATLILIICDLNCSRHLPA